MPLVSRITGWSARIQGFHHFYSTSCAVNLKGEKESRSNIPSSHFEVICRRKKSCRILFFPLRNWSLLCYNFISKLAAKSTAVATTKYSFERIVESDGQAIGYRGLTNWKLGLMSCSAWDTRRGRSLVGTFTGLQKKKKKNVFYYFWSRKKTFISFLEGSSKIFTDSLHNGRYALRCSRRNKISKKELHSREVARWWNQQVCRHIGAHLSKSPAAAHFTFEWLALWPVKWFWGPYVVATFLLYIFVVLSAFCWGRCLGFLKSTTHDENHCFHESCLCIIKSEREREVKTRSVIISGHRKET